ncbi:hypothetical protein K7W42_12985 [Deinococcus sp. HMF7604]|uniref:hypothetical protein n=1 Tax=Deinococcus betulae TaxID=2873312 RepID=UPI001CCF051D|nr:hypothetical protein [Deinococcus betulae]MBZ9751772.1 hypothetical protein [Deinococcus betulae]
MTRSVCRWWPVLALLTACTTPPVVPVPTSLSLAPLTSARIGQPLSLRAVVRDQWGEVMAVPVAWTSSQPALATVQGDTLTATRLTPTNQPLTLTASAGPLHARTELTTTGLEVTLGTYAIQGQADLGTAAFVRFRPESGGAAPQAAVTFTAPDGQPLLTDLVLLGAAGEVSAGWSYTLAPPQSGTYRAALTDGDTRFTASDEVDAASVAPFAAAAAVTIQPDRSYEIRADLTGQPVVLATAFNQAIRYFGQASANELPKRGTVSLEPGTYTTGLFTLPLKLGAAPFQSPTPLTFNLTYQGTGPVTLP